LGRQTLRLREKAGKAGRSFARALGNQDGKAAGALVPLVEGDTVHLSRFNRTGKVEKIGTDGEVTVLAEDLRITVPRADCRKVPPAGDEKENGRLYTIPDHVRISAPSSEEVGRELNVIGHTVPEALDKIDKYLDSAFLANYPSVTIIHGHGSGRLRHEISIFLKGQPQARKFRCSSEETGGRGITIVELA